MTTEKHPAFDYLGYHVTDTVSGVSGYVTSIIEWASGQAQPVVQPKGDGKDYPSPWNIDHHRLVKSDMVEFPTLVVVPFVGQPFPMLAKVQVKVSGIVGTIMDRSTFLNGCMRYNVQGKYNAEKDKLPEFSVDHGMLELVYDQTKPEPEPEPAKKTTGGPASRGMRG